MNNVSRFSLLYYLTAAATSLVLIIALLSLLNWPVVAEVTFGTALFLHALIISKTVKDLFLAALDKGLVQELFYSVRAETSRNRDI